MCPLDKTHENAQQIERIVITLLLSKFTEATAQINLLFQQKRHKHIQEGYMYTSNV